MRPTRRRFSPPREHPRLCHCEINKQSNRPGRPTQANWKPRGRGQRQMGRVRVRGGAVVRGPANAAPQGRGQSRRLRNNYASGAGRVGGPSRLMELCGHCACLSWGRGKRCFSLSHQIGLNGLRTCEC